MPADTISSLIDVTETRITVLYSVVLALAVASYKVQRACAKPFLLTGMLWMALATAIDLAILQKLPLVPDARTYADEEIWCVPIGKWETASWVLAIVGTLVAVGGGFVSCRNPSDPNPGPTKINDQDRADEGTAASRSIPNNHMD